MPNPRCPVKGDGERDLANLRERAPELAGIGWATSSVYALRPDEAGLVVDFVSEDRRTVESALNDWLIAPPRRALS